MLFNVDLAKSLGIDLPVDDNNILAQIFSGKSGSAKLALGFAYVQFLNCENRTAVDSCGACSSCLKFNNGVIIKIYTAKNKLNFSLIVIIY